MIQIVSDKQYDWANWLVEVMNRLEETPSISKIVIAAEVNDDDCDMRIVEYMNCNIDDIYYLGGVLQKEAIKHEIAIELGIDDDCWEEKECET